MTITTSATIPIREEPLNNAEKWYSCCTAEKQKTGQEKMEKFILETKNETIIEFFNCKNHYYQQKGSYFHIGIYRKLTEYM